MIEVLFYFNMLSCLYRDVHWRKKDDKTRPHHPPGLLKWNLPFFLPHRAALLVHHMKKNSKYVLYIFLLAILSGTQANVSFNKILDQQALVMTINYNFFFGKIEFLHFRLWALHLEPKLSTTMGTRFQIYR